ncbi:MAG TPA: carbon storage regulator CsrA [Syntrophomonas sp.]|jgi:carbon storage regulator|nr:carbon storage regulator CsrA [Syntrophomonas sp.]
MLVLTRRVEEGIIIADNIKIRIVAIDGGKVKLGITAANDIPIIREEIFEAVKSENRAAGAINYTDLDWSSLETI